MTRTIFEPFRELERLSRFVNNLSQEMGTPAPSMSADAVSLRVDVVEDENALHLFVELPGVRKEDVKVTVGEENILTIKGEKKAPADVAKTHLRERRYGVFSRSFALPDFVNPEEVKASFESGVLHLRVARMQPVQPKEYTISIQ